jgi:putative oxidoreductase
MGISGRRAWLIDAEGIGHAVHTEAESLYEAVRQALLIKLPASRGCLTSARGENIMKPHELIRSFLVGSRSWEQLSIVIARVSLGIFFAISGANKLFTASHTRQMYETLAGAKIPFPHLMTYFVSSVEFIGGCLLVIGFLSGLCCAAIIIQMVVAITTVQLAKIPGGLSFLDWLDDLLYLPETLYIIILIWLICSGPGRLSVDSQIFAGSSDQGIHSS